MAETPPPGCTTLSKFASDHLGTARSYVSKLRKQGRLVMEGDHVRVAESLALIRGSTGAPERAAAPVAGQTFTDARDRREYYQAEEARLNYEERMGRLMQADVVVQAVTAAAATLRSRIESLPEQLAANLPVPHDVQEQCKAKWREEIEAALAEMSHQFNAAAIGARA